MKFVKENLIFFLGIALPVFMALILVLIVKIPQYIEGRPSYKMIFFYTDYSNVSKDKKINISFVPKKGVLSVCGSKYPYSRSNRFAFVKNLIVFDPVTEVFETMSYPTPPVDKCIELKYKGKDFTVVPSQIAPDGYQLLNERIQHRSGFIVDVLTPTVYSKVRIKRGFSTYVLPDYYLQQQIVSGYRIPYQLQFVAWIEK